VGIKALPLSQSKQEKRTEGVITIQRGKDSWNQRPQTSGSSTPPLTRAPRTRARLHAHYHRPTPPLQRTTAAHPPLQRTHRHRRRQQAPSPLSHLLPRVTCSITTTPHPPEHPFSPIKPPPPAPSTPISLKAKHTLDKSPLPNRKQLHFPLPRP
jgi:hypothetical protein